MGLADKIIEKIKLLPEEKQTEVFDFVNFLEMKIKEEESIFCSKFSLESAMRGMEDEETLYTLNDLKETFS
jgi:hypothetical protein